MSSVVGSSPTSWGVGEIGGKIFQLFSGVRVAAIIKLLAVAGAGLTLWWAYDFYRSQADAAQQLQALLSAPVDPSPWWREPQPLPVNAEAAKALADQRNMFSLAPLAVQKAVPAVEPAKPDYSNNIEELALVGIIWDADKPQAIIEHKRRETTHLLTAGDTIDIFTVITIQSDSVILGKDGQTWTLR
jgi:hypothetical protein